MEFPTEVRKMVENLKIQILSERKKHYGVDEYTKNQVRNVNCFFYDEDCFWFDYGGKRFGLPILAINKLRKKTIQETEKAIKDLRKNEVKPNSSHD